MTGLKLLRGDADTVVSAELLKHIHRKTSEPKCIHKTATHMTTFGLPKLYKISKQHFPPTRHFTLNMSIYHTYLQITLFTRTYLPYLPAQNTFYPYLTTTPTSR